LGNHEVLYPLKPATIRSRSIILPGLPIGRADEGPFRITSRISRPAAPFFELEVENPDAREPSADGAFLDEEWRIT
jgi:hypothetical protein